MTVLAPEAAKAVTLTPSGEVTYLSFPIEKMTETDDGDLVLWGKASDGSLDSDGQIVDPSWCGPALKQWLEEGPAVRVQHQAQRDPAGKGLEVHVGPDGASMVKTLVVEPVAKELVRKGVLRDYSVGIANPGYMPNGDPRRRSLDPHGKAVNGIITGQPDGSTKIVEVSLCDRGANPNTRFSLVKAAADGAPEWVGKMLGGDVLTKDSRAPKAYKTVSVELPSDMKLPVTPAILAKMQTMAQQTAMKQAAAGVPEMPAPAPEPAPDAPPSAAGDDAAGNPGDAVKAADGAVRKRDIGTAARGRLASEHRALPDGSYPVGNHADAENAVTLILSGHGDVAAARRLVRRIAREEGWDDILARLAGKKKAKADKAGKCGKCAGKGMTGGVPCTECPKGARKAKRMLAKAAAPDAVKKRKVMCAGCGAKQNRKHAHCSECSRAMTDAIPVMKDGVAKNHDYKCLTCGRDPLDKGERYCPGCGTENPGYMPLADRKLPMNQDADKSAGKDRVPDSITKGKKNGKGTKGKKNMPPWMKPEGDDAAEKTPVTEKRKGGKKGKGRSPAAGAVSQDPAGLPPHREPDGMPVEEFEKDTVLTDGDEHAEMETAMRHKALGIDPAMAVLHDLTCPAYSPATVSKAHPGATFAGIDTAYWQDAALKAASEGDTRVMLDRYNYMAGLSRAAVTLKTADPQVLHDIRLTGHAAFTAANQAALKAFRDAMPGPGSFPAPAHPMPGAFRRPYLSAGHAAPSPQHGAPRSFAEPEGQLSAADYQRPYLSAGHAADSPANDTPRRLPAMQPMTGGQPENMHFEGTMADNARQAVNAMHDHVSRIFPDVCPMSPEMGETQKPAPMVPEAVGGPVPHKAKAGRSRAQKKADKAARAAKAAQRQAAKARKAAKAEQVKSAQRTETAPPPPAAPALDPEVFKAAVAEATSGLRADLKAQRKAMKAQARILDAIAGQPDTTSAPFRGAGVAKTASVSLAGPLSAAQSAEQAQAAHLQRLSGQLESWNPAEREAAWTEITAQLGITPRTGPTTMPLRHNT